MNRFLIGVVVVVFVVVGGYFIFSSLTQKTTIEIPEGWTEYQNEDYRFTLRYPDDLTLNAALPASEDEEFVYRVIIGPRVRNAGFYQLEIYSSDLNGKVKEIVNQKNRNSTDTLLNQRIISMFGLEDVAELRIRHEHTGRTKKVYVFSHNGYTYVAPGGFEGDDWDIDLPEYNQIADSLALY